MITSRTKARKAQDEPEILLCPKESSNNDADMSPGLSLEEIPVAKSGTFDHQNK